MPRTVWKYALKMSVFQNLETGADPRVVYVGTQRGEPMVWVEHAVGQGKGSVRLELVGTGGSVPADGEFVGTLLLNDDGFVFHIYALPAKQERPSSLPTEERQ